MRDRFKRFEAWRSANPSRPYSDFYAEVILPVALGGTTPHPTLGANLVDAPFGVSGDKFAQTLVKQGLQPEHKCVDYGCGTLRIGHHLMRFLRAGHYWGLDISARVLDEGRQLIGPELHASARPNLRVISPATIAEAASARPEMLFSVMVLRHVHPDELQEYLSNIFSIIGDWGRAFIDGIYDGDTTENDDSWSYGLNTIAPMVSALGGELRVVRWRTAGDREKALVCMNRRPDLT
jgi:SAM-dependent methyltransferase